MKEGGTHIAVPLNGLLGHALAGEVRDELLADRLERSLELGAPRGFRLCRGHPWSGFGWWWWWWWWWWWVVVVGGWWWWVVVVVGVSSVDRVVVRVGEDAIDVDVALDKY